MYPAIHFDYLEAEKWAGQDTTVLYQQMDHLRKKVKYATNYNWDNSHFYITSLFGKIILEVGFYPSSFALWSYTSGIHIGSFEPATITRAEIKNIVKQTTDNKSPCYQCKQWIANEKLVRFGFTGGVCKKCYNPKVHLPPDTSGD